MAIGVLFLGGTLGAQGADLRILGKDDFEFANALSRAGYQDLASIVLNTIEGSNGGSGACRSRVITGTSFTLRRPRAAGS